MFENLSTERRNDLGYIGKYELLRELNFGTTSKVFMALDPDTREKVAIKVFKYERSLSRELLQNEMNVLKQFNHVHIVRVIEAYESIELQIGATPSVSVSALVMEYVSHGELFDLLKNVGSLDDDTARRYFSELLDAIQNLHSKQITHRDIKPENVMFDERGSIKLIDFGYAAFADQDKLFDKPVGTRSYLSPEIHLRLPHSGYSADLFAAGIILFAMVAGHMPFRTATTEDKNFSSLCSEKPESFWESHESKTKKQKKDLSYRFDDTFKDLVAKMLSFEPSKRPTIQEIRDHPWFRESTLKN